MAEIVRFVPVALIARQIIRLLPVVLGLSVRAKDRSAHDFSAEGRSAEGLSARACPLTRRMGRGARPELEHPMLVLRRYGPLGFHCCQLRDILTVFSTLAARLAENVDMARMRKSILP